MTGACHDVVRIAGGLRQSASECGAPFREAVGVSIPDEVSKFMCFGGLSRSCSILGIVRLRVMCHGGVLAEATPDIRITEDPE